MQWSSSMRRDVYRYQFDDSLELREVQTTLCLAIIGAQGLHGDTQMLLDARYWFDPEKRAAVIDASTEVGKCMNRLFASYMRDEYGRDTFKVERVDRLPEHASSASANI